MLLSVCKLSRSAWYKSKGTSPEAKKRGPKTSISDKALTRLIRRVIRQLPFHGVGYKKIHRYVLQKLQNKSISVGKNRIFRLMKQNNELLKPSGGSGSSRTHNGKLTTEHPDEMWASDGKKFWTKQEGYCWFFGVIDHFNSEIISWHVAKRGDRFESIKPVIEAILCRFGKLKPKICEGMKLRTDLGSPYTSKYFRKEMGYYGMEQSFTFARSPESNGIIERFHRTLNEQVFSVNQFNSMEEAKVEIREFIQNYNQLWILERLGYKTPLQIRKIYKNNLLKKCA